MTGSPKTAPKRSSRSARRPTGNAGRRDTARVASSIAIGDPSKAKWLTPFQREKLDYMRSVVSGRLKPMKPMVSINNLSPEFMRLAIELDVALCEYRDIATYAYGVMTGCQTHGIRHFIKNEEGHTEVIAWVEQLYEARSSALSKAHGVIIAIEKTKAVTGGDRRLKKLAPTLRCCQDYRQLDGYRLSWATSDWVGHAS